MSDRYRERFESMVEGLQRNPRVRVLDVSFGKPAPAEEIEYATELANGQLPAGVEDLYREMNGFNLEWEHTVEEIKQGDDRDRGFIHLLTISRVFGDWRNITWFEDIPASRQYQPAKPFDAFVPEACAAFYQAEGQPPEDTIYYHAYGRALEPTGYRLTDYLDRLLASRGYFYWIRTLLSGYQDSQEVSNFRRNMPRIFDDYQDEVFQPKMERPTK